MTPRYTGLLGGSFNPAHGGHRRITRLAISALALDEAWWLVSPGNPLKPKTNMAPLRARFKSAEAMSRRAPIVPTAIELQLSTRYTVETLTKLKRRYPRRRFVWLMGSDNLAQFHMWKGWRQIAQVVPIAVIARPGYNSEAMTSPAMAFLRRYRVPLASLSQTRRWTAPAMVFMRFDPDARSATQIRQANSDWAQQYLGENQRSVTRDKLTFRKLSSRVERPE